MLKRFSPTPLRPVVSLARLTGLLAVLAGLPMVTVLSALADDSSDDSGAFERAIVEAERALQKQELQIAESRYRDALLEGWLLRGALAAAEGDFEGAEAAFEEAGRSAAETRRARTYLALVQLRLGRPEEAANLLREVVARQPRRISARRQLAQALVAAGRPEEAVQELEEALALQPEDAESAFNLATGYLRLGKLAEAERLFGQVRAARPIPQTEVLIGRMYRDYKYFDEARQTLAKALEMDPRVRRARYYLGTVELLASGRDGLEDALERFESELEIAPDDPMTNLYLGLALAESWRYEEALPRLAQAESWPPARLDALRYRGRSFLGLNRPDEAVTELERALAEAEASGARDRQLSSIHYQLGLALRRAGQAEEAGEHFEAAESFSGKLIEGERERFQDFLDDSLDREREGTALQLPVEVTALRNSSAEQRRQIEKSLRTGLARAYFNLGVLQIQRQRVARAARLFEHAVEADPSLPQLQRSLGIAYFNSERYAAAVAPLTAALAQEGDNAELRRMLALAYLNSDAYEEAANLLTDDPRRRDDPSLQYAYAMALTRSGRASQARAIFDALLLENADWPELHVLLGQAHAQADDYDAAIAALEKALELRADVAEAHATLGDLYLRQGRLEEAERELRAELAAHPGDLRSRYLLATVLDLSRQPEAAKTELGEVLAAQPDFANARYLLGKILLAEGEAADARGHLEAAARLAPEDPNIFYQLGQAYQRLGRAELAARQFEIYRDLKQKERGSES